MFSLDRELKELKTNRSALMASLKNPAAEVVNVKRAGKKKQHEKNHNCVMNWMKHLNVVKFCCIIIILDHPQSPYKVFQRIQKLHNSARKSAT